MVKQIAGPAFCSAGQPERYEFSIQRGSLKRFEADWMWLKVIDCRARTVAPDDFGILAVIRTDVQDHWAFGGFLKERSQQRLFTADNVIAPVLEAEAAQRQIEQQIVQSSVPRATEPLGVGSPEAFLCGSQPPWVRSGSGLMARSVGCVCSRSAEAGHASPIRHWSCKDPTPRKNPLRPGPRRIVTNWGQNGKKLTLVAKFGKIVRLPF